MTHRVHSICLVAACSAAAGAAQAQQQQATWSASVSAQTTWTSNAGLVGPGLETEDTITEVTPSLGFHTRGRRLRLSGDVGASAINYVNGTGRDQVQPHVRLLGNLEAIERLFFVDASVVTTQLAQDPFVGRTEGSTSTNVMTATTYTVSPYVDWRLSARTRLLLRNDQTRTQTHGATTDVRDGRFSRSDARFEVAPQPLGLTLNTQRNQSRFSGQAQDSLQQTISRATLLWAPAPEWILSARSGREKTEANGMQLADDTIYGGGFEWRPGSRTVLRGMQEHRFFGTGWDAAFTHRMPWLAWDVRATRELTSFPQELLTLTSGGGMGGNVALLLDAMLTTRFPDPVERARQVQEIIRSQGLPATLGGSLTIYTQEAFISTARSISLGLMGVNSSVTWSGSTQRVQTAQAGSVGSAAFASAGVGSSDQFVSALNVSHRVGRAHTFSMTLNRASIEGLGAGLLDETVQRSVRVALTQQLSPRTQLTFGARRRLSESRIAADFTENAVFAALSTRV